MNFRGALKWALYDRVLAVVSLAVGLGIAVGALWIGTGQWFLSVLGGDLSGGPSGTSLLIAAGGVLLGLFVWQLGKTAARHRTIVSATEQRVHGRLAGGDAGELQERVGQIESDVEEVRRVAARIESAMREGEFDAEGLEEPGAPGSASTSASAGAGSGDASAGPSGSVDDGSVDATPDAGRSGSAATGGGSSRDVSGSRGSASAATGSGDADNSTAEASSAASAGSAADAGPSGVASAASETAEGEEGLEFSGSDAESASDAGATASADDAEQVAASTTDGGTTDGESDDESGDAFEWAEEADEGEYYRDA